MGRTLGTCLIRRGRYAEAVDSLQRALDYVTYHHYHYYACSDSIHHLYAYHPQDSIPLELRWMNSREVQTVPEWIARIREQLSIAYAGMGLKDQSDYNRNIYLDILDVTRQDKELESRYERLERESAQLDAWLLAVILTIVVVIAVFVGLNRRWRKNNAQHVEKLRQALEFSRRLLVAVPDEDADEEEVATCLSEAVQADFESLFGCRFTLDEKGEMMPEAGHWLSKDERALLEVIRPYWEHAVRNARYFVMLGDEQQQLAKEKYIHEQHIVDNKRRNIVKKACVSIVTGIVISAGRVFGEAAALIFTSGSAPSRLNFENVFNFSSPTNPFNIFRPACTLAVYIWRLTSEPTPGSTEIVWGTATVLIACVLLFNVLARVLGKFLARRLTAE